MITWYFDLISPFAYLALNQVEALGPTVTYRPILFAGVLKHWGQLGPAEIPPKRLNTYRLCVWEAQQRRIPFRFPPLHPFNPLQALRLLVALKATPTAVRTAMEVIWAEGRDVSAPDGWGRLLERLGASETSIDTAAKDGLRANTEAAIGAGVFGVPTLEIGHELFWGLDAIPLARAAIADPGLLDRGEMGRLARLPGAQRTR